MTILEYKKVFLKTTRIFCLNPIDIIPVDNLEFRLCGQGVVSVMGEGWKGSMEFVIDNFPLNPFRNFKLKLTTYRYVPFKIKRKIQKEFDRIDWSHIIDIIEREELEKYGE